MTTAVAERESASVAPIQPPHQKASILVKIAARYSVEPGVMLDTLKSTAFRQRDNQPPVTNEQMVALLIVADQYKLNPFTKEIYAFPDKGGIVPVVGVDGWARIINEHPQFDGMDFVYGSPDAAGVPDWVECVMHRKDRSRPTVVREFLRECRRGTQPWQSHPTRMLRHKAMIQCARIAFGFAGIFDDDEAERIIERDMGHVTMAAEQQFAAPSAKPKAAPESPTPTPNAVSPAEQRTESAPAGAGDAPAAAEPPPPPESSAPPFDLAPDPAPKRARDDGPRLSAAHIGVIEKKAQMVGVKREDVEAQFGGKLETLAASRFTEINGWISSLNV